MLLAIRRSKFGSILPGLVDLWPKHGHWSPRTSVALANLMRVHHGSMWFHRTPRDPEGCVLVSTRVSPKQLSEVGERIAARSYSTPWRYQKHFDSNPYRNYNALKIRPGATIPIALNGIDTTAHVNTVRRMRHRGSKHYLHLNIVVDTKNIPVVLDRETQCNCLYCGTSPKGDEANCRGCGAPLPPC